MTTIAEARDLIREVSVRQGEPLTMDVCEEIARRLLSPPKREAREPGWVARHERERYEE